MKEKILIVDDEPYILSAISFVLRGAGYDVLTAQDGEEAVRCAVDKRPKIIILDIMLPGMDGYEVTRRLKNNEKTHDIYIILFTAKSQVWDMKKGFECGADDYIIKPFSPYRLLELINDVVNNKNRRVTHD